MSKYKAVGVLENFNTTLHLFNRALALPNYDWLEEFDRGEGGRLIKGFVDFGDRAVCWGRVTTVIMPAFAVDMGCRRTRELYSPCRVSLNTRIICSLISSVILPDRNVLAWQERTTRASSLRISTALPFCRQLWCAVHMFLPVAWRIQSIMAIGKTRMQIILHYTLFRTTRSANIAILSPAVTQPVARYFPI